MKKKRIAVVGGGASGLFSAISAARSGAETIVFEKQNKVGRKLAITGNGQCNITNASIDESRYHGENPAFVKKLFSVFGYRETVSFFQSIGLPLIEKKNGKIYPRSLQAQSVVDLLEYELQKSGGRIELHRRIDSVERGKNGSIMIESAGKERSQFDSVIIAAGSLAYPQIGGSREGYSLAQSIGHTLVEPFPAIIPINIPLKSVHRLEGIKWDCRVEALSGNNVLAGSEGEILFTRYGFSGPAALEVSRAVNQSVLLRKKITVRINLFPSLSKSECESLIFPLFELKERSGSLALSGVLKRRMPDVFLALAGVDPAKECGKYTKSERDAIICVLTGCEFVPGDLRPFSEAVIASGGISTDEVNPSTMESMIMPGVFLCGEILDIDGDSGGFNLQFAWSSGAVAGINAVL